MQQSACAAGHVGIFFIISLTWVSAVSQVLVASVIGLHPFCRGGRETVILLVSIFPGSFHVRLSRSIQLCLLEVLLLLFNSCINTYCPLSLAHYLWLCSTFYLNNLLVIVFGTSKSFCCCHTGKISSCFDSVFICFSRKGLDFKNEFRGNVLRWFFISAFLGTRSQELKLAFSTDPSIQFVFLLSPRKGWAGFFSEVPLAALHYGQTEE